MIRNILFVTALLFSIVCHGQISTSSDFSLSTGYSYYLDYGLGQSFAQYQLMYPFSSFFDNSGTPVFLNYSQNIHLQKYFVSIFLGYNYYPAETHKYNIDVNQYNMLRYGVETGYSLITKPNYVFTPSVLFGSFRIVNSNVVNAPKQWLTGLRFMNEFELNENVSLLLTPSLQAAVIPEQIKTDLEYSQKLFVDLSVYFGIRYKFNNKKN
jgi:hypothetical protein